MQKTTDKQAFRLSGLIGLAFTGALYLGGTVLLASASKQGPAPAFVGLVCVSLATIALTGMTLVQPNEARVLTFFGKYIGTIGSGFSWVTPLTQRTSVSMRVSNFISEKMKVNDSNGNPIEIASVIVWQVENPAQAVFDVRDYGGFVRIQAETALRKIASQFPYDSHGDKGPSLRGSAEDVCNALRVELQGHLSMAGIVVVDAQISHLAYAPEIAQAMLRRQQAQAIIAARMQIVDGAVGMVELALRQLGEKKVVHLDEERKAQMVSNLLVTLVSESSLQPVVNTGSIY